MSNVQYDQEAQQNISEAENKLSSAIDSLKAQEQSSPPGEMEVTIDMEEQDNSVDASEKKEPHRTEFVETDNPKIQERINDLYGQAKKSDSKNQMLLQQNEQLTDQLQKVFDELEQIKKNNKDTESSKVENDIKQQLKSARENDDFDSIQTLEDQLLDLRLEKRLESKLETKDKNSNIANEPQLTPEQQQYQQQLIHNATYIESLAQEKDTQGNLKRPYLYDWHPDNKKAVELFESIPAEFAAAGKQVDVRTLMDTLEQRLTGKNTNASHADVLGTDQNNSARDKKVVKLTSEQVRVAKRMGISPEAYAKQLQLLNR